MHHYNLRRMTPESSSTQSTISIPSSDPSNSASSSTSQPMIVHTLPSLQFDMVNMDAFFHTFEAHYAALQYSDEQLYFELLKCLTSEHIIKFSSSLNNCQKSYLALKNILLSNFTSPLHVKFTKLINAPQLGDRSPSQLLCDFKHIMGTYNNEDATIQWFFRTEFVKRMPPNVKTILAAFESHSLEDIAKIADSIMMSEQTYTSPQPNPNHQDALSFIVQELNSIKLEIANLQQHNQSQLSHTPLQTTTSPLSPRLTQPHLPRATQRIQSPVTSSIQRPPGPNLSIPGRSELRNGVCFYHRNYPQTAKYCIQGCSHYASHMAQRLNH